MGAVSAIGVRQDPLLSHDFVITLLDSSSTLALGIQAGGVLDTVAGGFSECTGLEMSLDVEEYREGGRNGEALQFPTRVRWSKITLKKGLGTSAALWDWHYGFVTGTGKRRDGLIALLNEHRTPAHIWHFRRGLPTRYTGPSMNAAQGAVAIETIEITHEGIYQLAGVAG